MSKVLKVVLSSCALLFAMMILVASSSGDSRDKIWHFDNLDGWVCYSQDQNPDQQISIVDGNLRIFTREGSVDRKKARTAEPVYTTGRYTWRVFLSDFGAGDQCSVGAWIYNDDEHEIDFEIGYGKDEVRKELGAKEDDVVAYMTTQANPFLSVPVLIKKGWHIFELDLTLVGGNYHIKWFIDGEEKCAVQQTFGNEYKFNIHCSVENLKFIGDKLPSKDNYGLFDYVKYVYHD